MLIFKLSLMFILILSGMFILLFGIVYFLFHQYEAGNRPDFV
jgi:hypothetical protein